MREHESLLNEFMEFSIAGHGHSKLEAILMFQLLTCSPHRPKRDQCVDTTVLNKDGTVALDDDGLSQKKRKSGPKHKFDRSKFDAIMQDWKERLPNALDMPEGITCLQTLDKHCAAVG